MAMTLSQLQNQLAGLETYTPESEETLRQRAAAVYDPQYQQDVKSLAESLQLQLNQQERGAVRTGMQRSSYANSALAGLRGAGLKAQEQLAAQREGNIANLLLQLIQGEKDRKADADKQRDNLLLNLYQLGQAGSSGTAGSNLVPANDALEKAKNDPNRKGVLKTTSMMSLVDMLRPANSPSLMGSTTKQTTQNYFNEFGNISKNLFTKTK